MKLEAGKTYVFKDDAARDEYLEDGRFNILVDSYYEDGFLLDHIDKDGFGCVIDHYGDAVEIISPFEIGLFKEKELNPFDISEYEFSDSIGVGTVQPDGKGDLVVNLNKGSWIHIDKLDAEAIAKHFKLI